MAVARNQPTSSNFVRICGKAFAPKPSVIGSSPSPSPEVHSVTVTLTDESEPIKDGVAGTAIRVGTWVFGAFSAISLLVSIVKGLVPIYLLEAAGWAGAAWYWQGKKTHSEFAKAVVVVIAILIGIGEVIHIVSQAGESNTTTSTSPYAVSGSRSSGNIFDRPSSSAPDYSAAGSPYQNQASAAIGSSSASDIVEIEQKAVSLYKQKRYVDARPLFVQSCDGGDRPATTWAISMPKVLAAHATQRKRAMFTREPAIREPCPVAPVSAHFIRMRGAARRHASISTRPARAE